MKEHVFEFVVGVNPGYFHDNPTADALTVVADAWDKAATELSLTNGLYVPAVMFSAKAVYKTDWGCPVGGEDVVIVRGNYNPSFCDTPIQWSSSVALICESVKKRLGQKTATLMLQERNFLYLTSQGLID